MTRINFVAKRPAVSAHSATTHPDSQQVHPRVLTIERQCCDCNHSRSVPKVYDNLINCTFHDRFVGLYDECSAFEKKVENPHGT